MNNQEVPVENEMEEMIREMIENNHPLVMPVLNKLFEKTLHIKLEGKNYTEVFLTGNGQSSPKTCEFRHVEDGKLLEKKG